MPYQSKSTVCNLPSITTECALQYRRNHFLRIVKHKKKLKNAKVNTWNQHHHFSFSRLDLYNALFFDANGVEISLENEKQVVFKFTTEVNSEGEYTFQSITPVIMDVAGNEIIHYSGLVGGYTKKLESHEILPLFENWSNRIWDTRDIKHFKLEKCGIAHNANSVKCLINANSDYSNINFFFIYAPVKKRDRLRLENKSSLVFYFSNSPSDDTFIIDQTEITTLKPLKFECDPPFVPYDNGHECCPI